ncbi:AAA 12 domain containing protein [Asbolus verrucosus]|uniref:AAA 12 domain containing protein n=1 Tax=Asbolus verrucosus TaxID=1661398 RepID=A0A482W5V9_ASBVE|nr:AAA 12 domain containing protein [Asbolus verrucosus]
MGPPNSFRRLNIYPNRNEILGSADIYLKKNIIKGPFESVEQYLDIQFRLLREDFMACLREGVQGHRSQQPTKNVDIYDNVRIFKDKITYNREGIKVKIPPQHEDSKKFMNGSLLLFTRNNFDSIILAKVARRNSEKCEAVIEMVDGNNNVLFGQSYTMAECCTYFDPYFHVLRVLQTMSSNDFPMEKYIIWADTSKYIPEYLLNSNLNYKIGNFRFPPQMLPKFRENVHCLNEAQFKAFRAAISQEFAVIQGPPGTGKTFLGLKIAKTLIENQQFWYRSTPMLVISHKNHALDQFLEGLIPITKRLLRVGGQCRSGKLKEFLITNESNSGGDGKFRNPSPLEYVAKMRESLVVGMTTSFAARWKECLEELRSPIVIVEEAAEVLEAHVVAALTQHCRHVILLGDHQQLQPITSDHVVGAKYHLGLSLFERMINNEVRCYTLKVQHRMRPEISNLLKATIYPFLEDDESVLAKPPVLGVAKNVFFVDHRHPEHTSNATCRRNSHEAEFLVAFARYLILNGYKSSDLVILAAYAGQVQELEQRAKSTSNERFLRDVKISTLDAFQGQESDVVLLSLVRSEEIGFLYIQNRVCVGLSRAKSGFFIIGNMDLLSRKSVVSTALFPARTALKYVRSHHNHSAVFTLK